MFDLFFSLNEIWALPFRPLQVEGEATGAVCLGLGGRAGADMSLANRSLFFTWVLGKLGIYLGCEKAPASEKQHELWNQAKLGFSLVV